VDQTHKDRLLSTLDNVSTDIKVFQSKNSLRLTAYGCKLFKRNFDHWIFESPKIITSGQIIHLQRTVTYPYYFDKRKIILFNEKDAFIAKLGGIDQWLVISK